MLISELFSSPPLALDNPRSRLRRPRSYVRRGRSFSSSCSSHRHAIEPKRDRHKPEEHKLSAAVVDVLDRARSKRSFEDFIIVAPRRRIGEIRALLSERVRDCLREQIAKDLTKSTDELVSSQRPRFSAFHIPWFFVRLGASAPRSDRRALAVDLAQHRHRPAMGF